MQPAGTTRNSRSFARLDTRVWTKLADDSLAQGTPRLSAQSSYEALSLAGVRERSTADAPARAAAMATARLARLRSGIPQPPRTSAFAGTVSNKPPSDASDGGPERNRKRPVRSGASVYGTAG